MSDDHLVDAISRAIEVKADRAVLAQAIRNEIDRRIADVLATMLRHRNSQSDAKVKCASG